jgi:serine/threonine-protein kinase RsbW
VDFCGKENREWAAMTDLAGSRSARRVALATSPSCARSPKRWTTGCGSRRYPGKDIFAVRLALGEAAVNAFRHGNQGDPNKVVRVAYLVMPAEVAVEAEGEGPDFDPGQVSDPLAAENRERVSGRGLLLMRVYMSGVAFDRQVNRVTFCRRRFPAQSGGLPMDLTLCDLELRCIDPMSRQQLLAALHRCLDGLPPDLRGRLDEKPDGWLQLLLLTARLINALQTLQGSPPDRE